MRTDVAVEGGVDHVRGRIPPVIPEYGDYECPYLWQLGLDEARFEHDLSGGVKLAGTPDAVHRRRRPSRRLRRLDAAGGT